MMSTNPKEKKLALLKELRDLQHKKANVRYSHLGKFDAPPQQEFIDINMELKSLKEEMKDLFKEDETEKHLKDVIRRKQEEVVESMTILADYYKTQIPMNEETPGYEQLKLMYIEENIKTYPSNKYTELDNETMVNSATRVLEIEEEIRHNERESQLLNEVTQPSLGVTIINPRNNDDE